LNEEIALAELEIHDTKIDELDLEGALNFAANSLSNAGELWIQCYSIKNKRFQRVPFFKSFGVRQ
jgi:hypothetical protein